MRTRGITYWRNSGRAEAVYYFSALSQDRITPRAVARRLPQRNAIIPCRETYVLSEIETQALVRRRNDVAFCGRSTVAEGARAMRCSLFCNARWTDTHDRTSGAGLHVGGHNGEVMAGHAVDPDNTCLEGDRSSLGRSDRCVFIISDSIIGVRSDTMY